METQVQEITTQAPGKNSSININRTFEKRHGKFGRENRDGFKASGVPNVGPGSYDMGGSMAKKGYSYGKQPRDGFPGSANPGPGTYEYNTSSFKGPRIFFYTKTKNTNLDVSQEAV